MSLSSLRTRFLFHPGVEVGVVEIVLAGLVKGGLKYDWKSCMKPALDYQQSTSVYTSPISDIKGLETKSST
jgi:hypothetical protein